MQRTFHRLTDKLRNLYITNFIAAPKTAEPINNLSFDNNNNKMTIDILLAYKVACSGITGCLRPPRIACCQNWNHVESIAPFKCHGGQALREKAMAHAYQKKSRYQRYACKRKSSGLPPYPMHWRLSNQVMKLSPFPRYEVS